MNYLSSINCQESKKKFSSFIMLFLSIVLLISLFNINVTYAQDTGSGSADEFSQGLCNILNLAQGSVAKTIAVFAIIAVGVAAVMGKIQWGFVLTVAVGVIIIFAAPAIVNIVSGETVDVCANA